MSFEENRSFEYASVYLIDNPYCIDCTYDYFIPQPLRGEIGRGSFVAVPFGRSNRKQMAIVQELTHSPMFRDAKPIDSVCADRHPLDEEAMQLVAFMKDQFLCTIGEAVRCVVPSSVIGKMNELLYPIPAEGPDASQGFTASDLFVYEYILSGGGRTTDSVKVKFGAQIAREAIDKLLSKGFIGKELFVGKTIGESFENFYALAIPKCSAEAILEGNGEIKLRSAVHKAVIGALLKSNEPLSAETLKRDCSAGSAQFKALIDKGIIRVEPRRVWRNETLVGASVGADVREILLNEEQSAA